MTQVQIDAEALLIIMEYAYLGEHRQGGDCRHELVPGCPLCDSFQAGLQALEDAGHEHRPDPDWWSDPEREEESRERFDIMAQHGVPVQVIGPDEYFKRHPYRSEED